jgi:ketosteroid isomerase-like protein
VLSSVFADDVTYLPSPWAAAIDGIDALGALWEEERDGPDEDFTMAASVVAVDGDVGVARVEVTYEATGGRWRDLWVVTLAADGRCRSFEEWPFAPDQPDGHG